VTAWEGGGLVPPRFPDAECPRISTGTVTDGSADIDSHCQASPIRHRVALPIFLVFLVLQKTVGDPADLEIGPLAMEILGAGREARPAAALFFPFFFRDAQLADVFPGNLRLAPHLIRGRRGKGNRTKFAVLQATEQAIEHGNEKPLRIRRIGRVQQPGRSGRRFPQRRTEGTAHAGFTQSGQLRNIFDHPASLEGERFIQHSPESRQGSGTHWAVTADGFLDQAVECHRIVKSPVAGTGGSHLKEVVRKQVRHEWQVHQAQTMHQIRGEWHEIKAWFSFVASIGLAGEATGAFAKVSADSVRVGCADDGQSGVLSLWSL